MLDEWGMGWNRRRIAAGDGAVMKPYRWWHSWLSRSLWSLPLIHPGGREETYTVEVWRNGDSETGVVSAQLYRDGLRVASSKLPVAFPVPGGQIEVAATQFGLKRCHYVTAGGGAQRLVPDPRTPEARRMRFDRAHPAAASLLGVASVVLLVIGLGLNALQLLEPLSQIPPIADTFGTFESPVHLPVWLNIALAAGAAIASVERGHRLRYHWLLDAGGN